MKDRQIGALTLQTPGKMIPRAQVLTIAAAMAFANACLAQDNTTAQAAGQNAQPGPNSSQVTTGLATQGNPPSPLSKLTEYQKSLAKDFYRAEFVILERRIEPSEVNEKMAGRLPEPPALDTPSVLRHTDETGATFTTLKLVPQKELHLSKAASRLQNSGRYRVLLAEGWYQAFPPDFKGDPLWVATGDWLPQAEHMDVQGTITIDRQRYLHVNVELNHWLPKSATDNLLGIDLNAETPTRPHPPRIEITPAGLEPELADRELSEDGSVAETQNSLVEESSENTSEEGEAMSANADEESAEPGILEQELVAGLNWPRAELLTWIHETRRMRSEEVHFLDSPTLGVLVFFKKIEPEDAAPLILKLGLREKQEPQEAAPKAPGSS